MRSQPEYKPKFWVISAASYALAMSNTWKSGNVQAARELVQLTKTFKCDPFLVISSEFRLVRLMLAVLRTVSHMQCPVILTDILFALNITECMAYSRAPFW